MSSVPALNVPKSNVVPELVTWPSKITPRLFAGEASRSRLSNAESDPVNVAITWPLFCTKIWPPRIGVARVGVVLKMAKETPITIAIVFGLIANRIFEGVFIHYLKQAAAMPSGTDYIIRYRVRLFEDRRILLKDRRIVKL